jgi:hypothetical protein
MSAFSDVQLFYKPWQSTWLTTLLCGHVSTPVRSIAIMNDNIRMLMLYQTILPVIAGEAAVASAAEQPSLLQGSDADKVLALGARILASMTPFVAAAAQRVSEEDLYDLTSRLHQVMLSAAALAARQRGQHSRAGGPAGAQGPAGTVLGMQQSTSLQETGLEVDDGSSTMLEQLQGSSARSRGAQNGGGHKEVTAKLAARMRRLAARKEATQLRMERRQLKQQSKKQGKQQQEQQPPAITAPTSRVHITDLSGERSYPLAGAVAGGRGASLDGGLGLGGGVSRQQVLGEGKAAQLSEEDRVHPWSWDVTQPLTVLSGGIKVKLTSNSQTMCGEGCPKHVGLEPAVAACVMRRALQ